MLYYTISAMVLNSFNFKYISAYKKGEGGRGGGGNLLTTYNFNFCKNGNKRSFE